MSRYIKLHETLCNLFSYEQLFLLRSKRRKERKHSIQDSNSRFIGYMKVEKTYSTYRLDKKLFLNDGSKY